MSAQIIDGKALAAATKTEAAAEAAALKVQGIEPCLAVILVGENPASQVYVRGKVKDCGECGIKSLELRMPETTTQEELLAKIAELAADKTVNGILVQLPLPKQIDERAVIDAIPPEKDVDGFSPVNVGRMQTGQPCFLPCSTAAQMSWSICSPSPSCMTSKKSAIGSALQTQGPPEMINGQRSSRSAARSGIPDRRSMASTFV